MSRTTTKGTKLIVDGIRLIYFREEPQTTQGRGVDVVCLLEWRKNDHFL